MKKVAVLRLKAEQVGDLPVSDRDRLDSLIYEFKLNGIKVADEHKLVSYLINHAQLITIVEMMLDCFAKVFTANVDEWIRRWGHKFAVECDGEENILICNGLNEQKNALNIAQFSLIFEERLDSTFTTLTLEETEVPNDDGLFVLGDEIYKSQ